MRDLELELVPLLSLLVGLDWHELLGLSCWLAKHCLAWMLCQGLLVQGRCNGCAYHSQVDLMMLWECDVDVVLLVHLGGQSLMEAR